MRPVTVTHYRYCNLRIEYRYKPRLFCSHSCSTNYRLKIVAPRPAICPVCSDLFASHRTLGGEWGVYCSIRCKNAAAYDKRRNKKIAKPAANVVQNAPDGLARLGVWGL